MGRISRNTIGMYDCLKGAIIILVILVHSFAEVWAVNGSTNYTLIWKILNSTSGVSMGTLLVISGYGFRPVKNWKGVKGQIRMLLKPILIVYIFAVIIKIPVNLLIGYNPFQGIPERLVGLLLGEMYPVNFFGITAESITVFWYFLALFNSWMLLTLIFRLFKKETGRCIAVIICVLVGRIAGIFVPWLPYCIVPSLLTTGFLYLGYILKKEKFLFSETPIWIYFILFVGTASAIFLGNVNLGVGYMQRGMIDYVSTLCGCILILKVYLLLFDTELKLYSPFMFIGRNAVLFISLHGFEKLVADWQVSPVLLTSREHLTAAVLFAGRMILLLLLYAIVDLFRKKILKKG